MKNIIRLLFLFLSAMGSSVFASGPALLRTSGILPRALLSDSGRALLSRLAYRGIPMEVAGRLSAGELDEAFAKGLKEIDQKSPSAATKLLAVFQHIAENPDKDMNIPQVSMEIFFNPLPAKGPLSIHQLTQWGYQKVLSRFLEEKGDPNETDTEGNTLLHNAAKGGQDRLMITLLRAGADLEAVNRAGRSPLDVAAAKGHARAYALLLEEGAKVDTFDNGPVQEIPEVFSDSILSPLVPDEQGYWSISFGHQVFKADRKLPGRERQKLRELVSALIDTGPVQTSWNRYSRIREHSKGEMHHCHLSKKFVAVWLAHRQDKRIEMVYVGNRQGSPY